MAIQDLVQKLLLGAVVSVSPIVNSGCGFEPQYVEEGCADVRGTWYQHGQPNSGWHGPDKEWGFSWYYLEQHGKKIEGRAEYEYYDNNTRYDNLPLVMGNVEGDRVYLQVIDRNGVNCLTFDAEVLREDFMMPSVMSGEWHKSGLYPEAERVSPKIERQICPWDK
jgi:hypothetical protein